jgi:hypothetical protein
MYRMWLLFSTALLAVVLGLADGGQAPEPSPGPPATAAAE